MLGRHIDSSTQDDLYFQYEGNQLFSVSDEGDDAVNVAMGVESFVSNIHEGNVSDALVDGVGIALDAIATILPVVPGGASTTIKAVRTADKVEGVLDVDKIIHKSNKVGPIPNG